MRESFYLYYADVWNSSSGKALVRLFGRTKTNKNVCVIDYSFKPGFFVLGAKPEVIASKVSAVRGVSSVSVVERNHLGKSVRAVRVLIDSSSNLKDVGEACSSFGEVFEHDVNVITKYFSEKKIRPTGLVVVEGEVMQASMNSDLIIRADSVVCGEGFSNDFIVASFDIETDSRDRISYDDAITLISLVSEGFVRSYSWKNSSRKSVEVVSSEALMIERFCEDVRRLNPDFLVAYNSNGFDFPFLRERARRLGVEFLLSKDGSPVKLERTRKGFLHEIGGVCHVDLYAFVSNVFGRNLKTQSYSLENVSAELLGEGKKKHGLPSDLWREGRVDELADYCEHDSVLTLKLFEKLKEFILELSRLSSTQPQKVGVHGFSSLVENCLISKKDDFLEIAPRKPGDEDKKVRRKNSFEGAYVHEPVAGVYEGIVNFDFRSMYPSIISAHNIGPDTLEDNKFVKKRKGLIPSVVSEIIKERFKVLEALKKGENNLLKAREQALKILANSVYGYLAYENARWYCIKCADEVTRLGREYLVNTIKKCEKEGLKTIYGDTDSVFLLLNGKSVDEAKSVVKSINDSNPPGVELKFEGFFKSGLFVKQKTGGKAAKKKYALASEKGDLIIKGFASIRSDSSKMSRSLQMRVLRDILVDNSVKKAEDEVKSEVKRIMKGDFPLEDLAVSTKLRRNVENYRSKGSHVKAAVRLRDSGKEVLRGSVIKYVITSGEGSISERSYPLSLAKDYDKAYYAQQAVEVVAEILEAAGIEKKVFLEKNQKSLLDF